MTWFQKPMLGVPLDWGNPLNKGCVMHLGMQEGHGNVVRDLSMYGNHGTVKNMAFPSTVASGWNPGRAGVGLNFDGTNDYVDCGHAASLNLTTGTISCWFKHAVAISGGSNVTELALTSGKINIRETLYFSASSSKLFFVLVNGEKCFSDADSWDTNWHHVTATSDGTDLKMYIEGVLQATTGNAIGQTFHENVNDLFIGKRLENDLYFTGSIDQVRIHTRAQTAKEVQDYYINPYQVYLDEDGM